MTLSCYWLHFIIYRNPDIWKRTTSNDANSIPADVLVTICNVRLPFPQHYGNNSLTYGNVLDWYQHSWMLQSKAHKGLHCKNMAQTSILVFTIS